LEVENLTVDYPTDQGTIRVVDGVSFSLAPGERVAIVGESGSGKSVTARALLRLNPEARLRGTMRFNGIDLLGLSERDVVHHRGRGIGMVFQDPFGSLDPGMRIGDQVSETLRIHGTSKGEAFERAAVKLEEVGMPRARERMRDYPHQLSGGLRQRVALAAALVSEPELLIADEVTTALDTGVQQQVLDLMYRASVERGIAVLLISHDLGVVAGFADRVLIMYSGRIVEDGPVEQVFANPQHPYTIGLLKAVPRITDRSAQLTSIPGVPPSPAARPDGCAFHPRCSLRLENCSTNVPEMLVRPPHRVACHLVSAQSGTVSS
jgi:peptide/nickel transport system ATP-binding protein/oligopeptide transport system ATP-binding protein